MEGAPGRLLDASLTGFCVAVPAGPEGERCTVTVDVGGGPVQVQCHIRTQRAHTAPDGTPETVLGLEAVPGQVATQGALSRALFQTFTPAPVHLAIPAQRQPVTARVDEAQAAACRTVLPTA